MNPDLFSYVRDKLSALQSLGGSSVADEESTPYNKVDVGDAVLSEQETWVQPPANASDDAHEVRQERVDELRRQVRSGTYEIPFSQLVRILASLFWRER